MCSSDVEMEGFQKSLRFFLKTQMLFNHITYRQCMFGCSVIEPLSATCQQFLWIPPDKQWWTKTQLMPDSDSVSLEWQNFLTNKISAFLSIFTSLHNINLLPISTTFLVHSLLNVLDTGLVFFFHTNFLSSTTWLTRKSFCKLNFRLYHSEVT